MVVRNVLICDSCTRNFQQTPDIFEGRKYTCDAFPDEIPIEIISGFDHRQRLGNEELLYDPDIRKRMLLDQYEVEMEAERESERNNTSGRLTNMPRRPRNK